ncbi:MAG: murein DD-endopeptidase MepM/ murein hydrolase activator NlpD [Gammaproteobacteria bacterium]|jgi:murein DD-endopeptidase MepM/ murein hydrolase activator NlpD
MRSILALTSLSFLMLCTPSLWAFPKQSLVPGGIALVDLKRTDKTPNFTFMGKPVLTVLHDGKSIAIVGLPLNLKLGEHFIQGHWGKEKSLQKLFFSVKDKQYSTQKIQIKDKRKVNPYAKDMDRILAEKKRKQKARLVFTAIPVDVDLLQPVKGIMTGSYGRRRIFNGQKKRPHSGMDIAADTGTPVLAPAAGKVIELGDFFFSGNMIYIDHGQGLITLFAHLSKTNVELGQTIKKGAVIGEVGATGRVTGPHLHWSLGLNGTWIDPELFLN